MQDVLDGVRSTRVGSERAPKKPGSSVPVPVAGVLSAGNNALTSPGTVWEKGITRNPVTCPLSQSAPL